MNFTINLSVESYPDGDVMVFDSDGNTIAQMPRSLMIKSMISNAKACDWLTLSDMEETANKILEAVEKEREASK